MLRDWWWWNWAVDAMTLGGGGGGGRCKVRRKAMAGGRGTAETKIIDRNYDNPNLNSEITEKPSCSSKITKLPPTPIVEFDFYTQARKTLSFLSPFGSDESPAAPPASVPGPNTLPSGVSHFLSGRHWENSRKRHKKSHSSSEKKSSAPGKLRGSNIWVETEDYFRQLVIDDVERLQQVSTVGFSGKEKCFLIPSFDGDDNSHIRYSGINRMLASACEKVSSSLEENGVELSNDGTGEVSEIALVQEENGPSSMDVDGDEGAIHEVETKEERDEGKRENGEKVLTSFSGVEWLLGSRSKVYLTSERPSKKRKLLGRDAGLEKLLVACPVEGLNSVCHYCSYGDMGDPLNCLIKCDSCGMVVHQRCYGVQEDVDSSWLCSWCKLDSGVCLNAERPCLLCPKPGGALKPVQKTELGSEDKGSEVGFAHLFCCQWMPEVYLESSRTMEPIMNLDEVKDTRRKLICYLCKVKWGACVRCSNGACRTSFHPICAREARHRMEIWGKLGYDEVELRAFCSKHSEVPYDSGCRKAGDLVSTADVDTGKLNGSDMDGELIDNKPDSESHPESSDDQTADKDAVDANGNADVNACSGLNYTMILKKLIDLGKVSAKDVASAIGVLPDSLNTMLSDNHLIPELQYKLLKWLKNHAHIGSLQKTLKVRIRSPVEPNDEADVAEGSIAVSVEESEISDAIPVKPIPLRRRTKSTIKIVKDDLSFSSKDNANDDTIEGDDLCGKDSNGVCLESLADVTKKMSSDPEKNKDNSANDLKIEDDLSRTLSCFCEDGLVREAKQSEQTTCSLILSNGEVMPSAYIHPLIYSELLQTKNGILKTTEFCDSAGARKDSQLEASSSSGLCCNNYNLQATSGDWISSCKGVNDQLVKARNVGVLELSPVDEVEGELIYYQHRILCNAVERKRISDGLISKVARSLPQEIDAAGKLKWDAVLVSQYNHELREAKKLGRKERRHKEAQAVLAAATAAAAASSRISSTRKDALEESANPEDLLMINSSDVRSGVYSQLNPRARDTISRSAIVRPSVDGNAELLQISSNITKEHPRICEICRRSETILNPVLVCTSCKVAVHLDCYRSVKSTTGPWHCELCEDLFSSQGSGAMTTNSWEKPYFVPECGLCGGTASAFRKSVDGQWIHALCAEWVLESTYRRGQVNPIEGMETVNKGIDACNVCRRKHGVCLKCSYGHCQSTFHPTCARSAGFYMTVRTSSGKLQHKAYCERHSIEQKAKADTHKHGIEEFKSLKQVRVELERLRLLCERIIKREKLKRELVLCSHDILASSRDSVLSALARHPFYQPEVSSESATTSIKRSGSETVQRSDDITVDSTVAGKRRVKIPMSMENDQKTDDSSTSQNLYTLKPIERVSSSGKQIQRVSGASQNILEDLETRSKYRKQTETFEKELIMTSDQATMKNQRLPKGFVYVPVRCLSKDKDTVPDACSREPVQRNG
ncbi:hypothetical protein ACJIZ3_002978 [Penstemon smallii]|uniref:Uncharacterized protein n=1 Tax=Penstemon smallii TaxID=265156 RepID=A0ABD3UAY3_9LAMI